MAACSCVPCCGPTQSCAAAASAPPAPPHQRSRRPPFGSCAFGSDLRAMRVAALSLGRSAWPHRAWRKA
eukprot:3906724-Alexandrium_andersonii.AAC.1